MEYQYGEHVRDEAREWFTTRSDTTFPSIDEAYVLPQFGEWPFSFSRIDAVYVWTQGGYQVSRSPEDYPLFLAVREQDEVKWVEFFESVNIPTASERQPRSEIQGPIQFVLDPRTPLDIEYVKGYPVIPREKAIAYMQEHYVVFKPALAMLSRMYDGLES